LNRIGFFLFIASNRLSLTRHSVQSVAGCSFGSDAAPVNVAATAHRHKGEYEAEDGDDYAEGDPAADFGGDIEQRHTIALALSVTALSRAIHPLPNVGKVESDL